MEIYELTFPFAEVYTVMKALKTLVVVECCVLILVGSL
jgi:hypothetical protein